jgi:hypothetical protein
MLGGGQLRWRVAPEWLSLTILVVSLTIGLFAMHTLPGMAMRPSMVTDQSAVHADSSHIAMMPTAPAAMALSGNTAAPAAGCATNHVLCLAVLRSTSTPLPLPAVSTTILRTVSQQTSLVSVVLVGSRAPPDVCLVRLCISRT